MAWKTSTTASAGEIGPEWFDEQEYSGLSVYGMIFELLDNSLEHRVKTPKHYPLEIIVQVVQSKTNKMEADIIRVVDNGTGMAKKIIPKAFSPYGMAQYYSSDPAALSEHGMGMKKALRGLGSNHKIITKQAKKAAWKIETDDIRYMPTKTPPTLESNALFTFNEHTYDHGTYIEITNLSSEARDLLYKSGAHQEFEKNLMWAIGQRYRNFLSQSYFTAGKFCLQRLDHTGKLVEEIEIEPVRPVYYFNPVGTHGKPWFSNHNIKSDILGEWEAKVTFGFAPRQVEKEWDHITDDAPMKGHPYYSSRRGAGFDITRKGIVLQTGFFEKENRFSSAYIIQEWSNVYTHVRGNITLVHGFVSKEEKTGVKSDDAWKECCRKIREILNGDLAGPKNKENATEVNWLGPDYAGYKKSKTDEDKNEENYRMGFINQYNGESISLTGYSETRELVFPKRGEKIARQHLQGFDVGIPDIVISKKRKPLEKNTIICEVKAPDYSIRGIDVYQLFCYMQEKGVHWGVMIGDSLADGAEEAINQIQNQPITGPKGEKMSWWKRRKLGNKGRYVIGFYSCKNGIGLHHTQDTVLKE